MLEAVGHPVISLERVRFGPLWLGKLEEGKHRRLTAVRDREARRSAAPMRLIALRGATTVDANEAEAILHATEELMRELLERNRLDADRS